MAARLRAGLTRAWSALRVLTQNVDDSPVKIPWKSWLAAGIIVAGLYAVDVPEHARQYKEARNRESLDKRGLHDVHRELPDGRLLMRDGSIRRRADVEKDGTDA